MLETMQAKCITLGTKVIERKNVSKKHVKAEAQLAKWITNNGGIRKEYHTPLCDRRKVIPLLVEHFKKKLNQKLEKSIKCISQDVYKIFMDYEWPGNIIELENTLEHSFVLCKNNIITVDDLPSELREKRTTHYVNEESNEYITILQALERNHWNKTNAANFLGMSRRTIYNKIKKYNIRPKQFPV